MVNNFYAAATGKLDSNISYGLGPPTVGQHKRGDQVFNSGSTVGGLYGWVCIASGQPGVWLAFGQIGITAGSGEHEHTAAEITTGILPISRLATGTPDGTKYIRDDGVLASPAGLADRKTSITVVGNGSTDDGPAIQTALSAVGVANHAWEFVVEAPPNGTIYINTTVQIESSNTLLRFQAPVVFGANGRIRIQGELDELPTTGKPNLTVNASSGATTITVTDATPFTVGDYIVIRGLRDGSGNATQRMENTITAIAGAVLTLQEPLDSTYEATYASGAYQTNFGTPNKTQVTRVVGSPISVANTRGATNITVTSTANFAVGDIVQVLDDSRTLNTSGVESGTNYTHRELAEVKQIVSGTVIRLSHGLHHVYVLAKNARILKVRAVSNSEIRDASVTWNAFGSGSRNAFELRYAVGCRITNCTAKGTGAFSWDRQAFRMADSYHSIIQSCVARSPAQTGSGQGYGVTLYGATNCFVRDCSFLSNRHSVLFFNGAAGNIISGCISEDCCISDYDLHGAEDRDNLITGCAAVGGNSAADDGSINKSACRSGNSTHTNGDFNNVFSNMLITNYAGAALEVVAGTNGVILKDSQIYNTSIGLRIKINSGNTALLTKNVSFVNNDLVDVATLTDVDGGATDMIDAVTIEGNRFTRATTGLSLTNTTKADVHNNIFIDPQQVATVYAFTGNDVDELNVTGNVFNGCYRGIKLTDCVNARIVNNTLLDLLDTTVIEDVGGNTNFLFAKNLSHGFVPIIRVSGAGPSTGGLVEIDQPYVSDTPEEHAMKEWNYDPLYTGAGSGQIVVSGTLSLMKITARRGGTITNLHVAVGTAGATLTASQNLAGIYDSSGTLIATSTNQATAWTSTGQKTMSLVSSVNIQAGRTYYIALLSVGTTPPSFVRGGATGLTVPNVLQSGATLRFSTNGTGLTALPGTITLSSNTGTGAFTFWVGMS